MAFDLAQLYGHSQIYDKALLYFGMAIEQASFDALAVESSKLAEYYMHRASIYEALGMLEHSKLDLMRITDADPSFVRRYHQMATEFEEKEQFNEADRIR